MSYDRNAERPERHGNQHWTHRTPDRVPRGENRWNAKLTAEKVRAIRARVTAAPIGRKTRTMADIAAELGVNLGHVMDIVKRRKWAHVT